MAKWQLLILGSGVMLAANAVRCARWRLLLPKARGAQLFFAVCLGYLCNSFIPCRAGELVRMAYAWRTTPHDFEQCVASVLVERVTDLLGLFLIGLILTLFFPAMSPLVFGELALGFAFGAAAIFLGLALVRRQFPRRVTGALAGIFNERIRFDILRCAWSFARNVAGPIVLSPRYLVLTSVMWSLYLGAYSTLLPVLDAPFSDLMAAFHAKPLNSIYQNMVRTDDPMPLLILCILPVIAGIAYALIRDRVPIASTFSSILGKHADVMDLEEIAGQGVFQQHDDYHTYLLSLFGISQAPLDYFHRHGLERATVVKLLLGGSGAITAMIQKDEEVRIRKFAYGSPRSKLFAQAGWLRENGSFLPLAEILSERAGENWCHYDMPYLDTSANLYERAHLRGAKYGIRILDEVLARLDVYHESGRRGTADDGIVDAYVREKVLKNYAFIKERMNDFLDLSDFGVNGERHSIDEWDGLLRPGFLRGRFRMRGIAAIHGDLTLENIITLSGGGREWFIIDPNDGNIFDSPLLDWAKLFQSLHLGYEIVNKSVSCHVEDNNIFYVAPYTVVYNAMYAHLHDQALRRFGAAGVREILLHEIVHYLRLIPYKFMMGDAKGALFFAQCCRLVREYQHHLDFDASPESGQSA